ncbi:helix-turn-helix domain-containing protein [Lacrimispora sp.]|uniref:helix-turn-helix domain-containing protein n=1 Tax=Lacrimispora sp. TaxID=2719234 RepID=UPI003460D343
MTHLEKRKALILNKLLEEETYITSKQLAAWIGVSVRTIKSDIALLNEIVEPCHITIEAVPHKGYLLKKGAGSD